MKVSLSRVPELVGYIVGLDVGQAQDYTALAVVEREVRASGTMTEDGEIWEDHYTVRHLHRPALKTPYPEVIEEVKRTTQHPKLKGRAELVVDATGVGRPVVDMLRERGCEPRGITITAGQEVTEAEGMWRVPKRILVSAMAIALQTNRLHVVRKLPLADTLSREMLNFKVKVNTLAHDSYEAWREGEHDDLVLAVALAVWWGERTAEGGPRRTAGDDMKERRRRAHLEKTNAPWWKERPPIDRGPMANWRKG